MTSSSAPLSAACLEVTLTLVHVVWVGGVIGLCVAAADALLRRRSPQARYLVNLVGLAIIALSMPAVFVFVRKTTLDDPRFDAVRLVSTTGLVERDLARSAGPPATTTSVPIATSVGAPTRQDANAKTADTIRKGGRTQEPNDRPRANSPVPFAFGAWRSMLAKTSPWIAGTYAVGVLGMLMKLLTSVYGGRRLRRASLPCVDARVVNVIAGLPRRLKLRVVPAVLACQRVVVPVVLGVLRPVIILPATMLPGLSADQLRAVLAHELAHIRRHDHIVLFLQRVIEAVLFFHPAVWRISHRLDVERENCCDDLALTAVEDRLSYAQSLLRLVELSLRERLPADQLALLAADGGSPSRLRRRVARLLGQPLESSFALTERGIASALAILGLAAVLAWGAENRTHAQSGTAQVDSKATETEKAETETPAAKAEQEVWPAIAPGNAWPQWGGTPHRNNVAAALQLPAVWDADKGENVRWTAKLGSYTFSSPVVAGGKVFVGTNNAAGYAAREGPEVDLACLLCFDESTGKFLWQYSSEKLPTGRVHDWPQIGLCSTPYVDGSRLWVVTNRAEVVCLDVDGFEDHENDGPFDREPSQLQHDADVIWKFDMMRELGVQPLHQAASSITCVGELLLVNTSNGLDESYAKVPAPDAPSFLALDRNTGRVVWSDNSPGNNIFDSQCPGTSPAAGVFDGVPQAIFAGSDGWLYSFDLRDMRSGKSTLRWRFDCNPKTSVWELGQKGTRNTLIATPVIWDGLVYIAVGRNPEQGEGDGRLWCIDPTKRGDISPELVYNERDPTQPIPHKPRQACELDKGDFTRVNPNSGVVWHYEAADANGDGQIQFEETMHRAVGSTSIHKGLLFIADLSGIVHCLDSKTGRVHWTHDLMASAWGTPLVADGKVYIGDEDGDVAAFKLAATKELLTEVNNSHAVYGTPAVANETLYLATTNRLLAIGERDAVAKSDGAPEVEAAQADRNNNVADGHDVVVVKGDGADALLAIDPVTSKLRWESKQGDVALGVPVVQGERVFVGNEVGQFVCLEASSGVRLWSFDAGDTINGGAAIHEGSVFFGTHGEALYCLDRETGHLKWQQPIGGQIHSTPVIAGNTVIVAACDGRLHFLDAATGHETSSLDMGAPTGNTPCILGERVFIGTQGGEVLCRRLGDDAWLWRTNAGRDRPLRGFAGLDEKLLVVGSARQEVVALDPDTGRIRWVTSIGANVESRPAIIERNVLVATSAGELLWLDRDTGAVTRHQSLTGLQPSIVVTDGQVVVVTNSGELVTIAPTDAPRSKTVEPRGGALASDAVGRAARFLLSQQESNGSWPAAPDNDRYAIGSTALAWLALDASNADAARDENVQKSLDGAASFLSQGETTFTYDLSLRVQVMIKLGGLRAAALVQHDLDKLALAQIRSGPQAGGWSYRVSDADDDRADNSNTVFALWALSSAALVRNDVGEPIYRVDPSALGRAMDYLLRGQRADGGWGYMVEGLPQATGSMTCGCLASLLLAERASGHKSGDVNAAKEKALAWLAGALRVDSNPGSPSWHLYYLMWLRRLAALTGSDALGQQDWSGDGIRWLAANQGPDGSWREADESMSPAVSTSMALLFLTPKPADSTPNSR